MNDEYFERCNILSDAQHAVFWAKGSTVSQLICVIHEMSSAINKDTSIHAVILDFEKAFDKVSHQRLLKTLQSYGIQGSLLKWLQLFLIGRYQTAVCEGDKPLNQDQ